MAQGILESNAGQSTLARKAKNHFGIKCHKGWTGRKYHIEDDDYDDHGDDRPGDLQDRLQENMESFGDSGSILWMKMMELVRKVETYEGWYLPQYSIFEAP